MKICPNCQAQLADEATFCNRCGSPVGAPQQPNGFNAQPYQQSQQYQAVPVKNTDHTAEFSPEEVHKYKLFALMIYVSSVLGILIAVIVNINAKSEYISFHIKQGIKLLLSLAIVGFVSAVLCWTIIVPFAGGIAAIIIMVADAICFVNTCLNKSVEPILISSFKFFD